MHRNGSDRCCQVGMLCWQVNQDGDKTTVLIIPPLYRKKTSGKSTLVLLTPPVVMHTYEGPNVIYWNCSLRLQSFGC